MKKTIIIILLIIVTLIISGCATKRKAREYSSLRGLMLLDNTQLGRNKHYTSPKYQRTLKNNNKKLKKR